MKYTVPGNRSGHLGEYIMATINIDNQLGLEYSFRIGGKVHKLIFSDDTALSMDRVNLKVDKILDDISNMDENELRNKTVDEQAEIMKQMYADMRDAIIDFYDEYMNDAGQEIYESFHQSTRALVTSFGKLYDYLNKVEINEKPKNSNVTSMKR